MKQINLFIINILFFITSISCAQQDESKSITMQLFKEKLKNDKDIIILDVRTPEELSGPLGKIDNAINIPVQVLEQRIDELDKYKSNEIFVICRTGHRSGIATEILVKQGYKAKNVLGGMTEFRK